MRFRGAMRTSAAATSMVPDPAIHLLDFVPSLRHGGVRGVRIRGTRTDPYVLFPT